MRKSFVVVIASYNNERWCRRNLESVLTQQYPQFRVIYIDDASSDDTVRLVDEYLAESGEAERVEFICNDVRVGPVANIDRAVRSCDPNDVIVLVDGDDFLAHRQVLTRLDTIYRDPDTWVTWGQFTRFPTGPGGFCEAIPPEIVSANAYRDYAFVSSHLRTFYAGLYHRIRLIDVQDHDGKFFVIAGDVAQMFALMEMAGPRGKFIPEILYVYNRENPLNDDKLDRVGQVRTEMAIRSKARYGRIASLSGTDRPREFYIGTGIGRSFFDSLGALGDMDDRRKPFRQMRSVLNRLGYTVRESQTLNDIDDPYAIAVFDVRPNEIERLAALPSDALSLVLWKDPIAAPLNFDARYHEPFGRIYTWRNDLVDNVRYFKLAFPFLRPMISSIVPFENRKLCAMMASNRTSDHPDALYDEERNVATYFSAAEPDSFDLYGWGWNAELNPNFRGIFMRRVERLRRYRFSFCYETVKGWSGFVTGKIFDSFEAGCVPVYWGAPDIADAIPRHCFIAREDFASEAELHAFLRDMPEREHTGYIERIRTFLSSPQAVPFSAGHFVRTFVELVGGRATKEPGQLRSSDARAGLDQGGGAAAGSIP
jgi:glycosyltransferase involved in cell wall biosynthesis